MKLGHHLPSVDMQWLTVSGAALTRFRCVDEILVDGVTFDILAFEILRSLNKHKIYILCSLCLFSIESVYKLQTSNKTRQKEV